MLSNGTRLNSLLYADDLIILWRSKLGLLNCLNVLSSSCNSWMLRINPEKTKIMVFQRCTRKCEHNFRIGNEVIDVVQNYTYSGTRTKSFGNFTLLLEHLRQKALHALFSLGRHTDLNGLKPSLACKIFYTSFNLQQWSSGYFCYTDFKSWDNSAIEKTHLQFCKRYLQVHNKASNIACRAELGKFPMIIDINKKILNYLGYLIGKDKD